MGLKQFVRRLISPDSYSSVALIHHIRLGDRGRKM